MQYTIFTFFRICTAKIKKKNRLHASPCLSAYIENNNSITAERISIKFDTGESH